MKTFTKTLMALMILGGVFALGVLGSFFLTRNYYKNNPFTKTETKVETKYETEYIEDTYLKTNACILYENYKDLYMQIDGMCNKDITCRGSAAQKEGYEIFQGWEEFRNQYCD